MTLAESAQVYLDNGFNVMPLHGKRPTGEWAELQRRRVDGPRLINYLNQNPNLNLGIVCGELSGITVVDVDIHEGFSFEAFDTFLAKYPTPLVVQTGSGGWHLYYGYQKVKNAVKIKIEGLALDVRSQGGYVVCPPSIHPDTKQQYKFINLQHPTEEMDIEMILSLRESLPPLPAPLTEVLQSNTKKLPDDWRAIIYNTNEGSRNQNAASIFGKLMGVLPPSEWKAIIWPLVQAWNEKLCQPSLPEHELQSTYQSVAKSALARLQWGGTGQMDRAVPLGEE